MAKANSREERWQGGGGADDDNATLECNYTVIGYGRVGRSAVPTIRWLDPGATVTVINPGPAAGQCGGGDGGDGGGGSGDAASGGPPGARWLGTMAPAPGARGRAAWPAGQAASTARGG